MLPLAAVVHVPKTAIYKNDLFPRCKNEIRLAGQITPMKPEPVTQLMQHRTYDLLRLCILASDGAHIGATIHCS